MNKISTLGLLSVTLLVLTLAAPLAAQVGFQRTYGDTAYDEGWSVAQTADGGYIIAGRTESFGAGYADVWLIKTDTSGDTMWTRTYGGTDYDGGFAVAQTADGGYVITGYTQSFSDGYADVYLVKTDANGDTAWTRTHGGRYNDLGYSVAQTADGGYVITGYTESYGAGYTDVWLIKTDASGDTMWTRTCGGDSSDYSYSVTQTSDSGYVIAGKTKSFGAGAEDVWLIKTDASGDTIWTRTYGGAGYDEGRSVVQTADGGYVIAGCGSPGAGYGDVWLIKTDASGDTIWTRTFGGASYDYGYSVAPTADGGYVVAGQTQSFGAGSGDVYLVKTDASGDTIWTRTFGGPLPDCGWSVVQTSDGGYVITGFTRSFGAGWFDVWLIKTDTNGSPAIAEPQPPVAQEPAPASIVHGVLHCPVWSTTTPSLRNVGDIALHNSIGRKVMDLTPGENDVRHLSPGVYFIRPAGTVPANGKGPRVQGFKGPSRKVILTR